ncbi:MAG: hypothetical protein HY265_01515, partial [Deltaproteobacteria bacterium]|nr:hypothetical protein [Deltaproteobacteria bacterium]
MKNPMRQNNRSPSPFRIPIKTTILCLILACLSAFSSYAHAAESAKSAEVSAVSDRTPPPAPTGLSLSLDGNGVKALWTVSDGAASYNLYRSNSPITDTTGLAPVASANTINATDPSPVSTQTYYAVTALDALGNESAPSGAIQITFPVAPVGFLNLERIDDGKPNLSWGATETGVQGYYIYRNGKKINETPTISTTYTDGYYYGGSVQYGVSVINNLNQESPVKEVTLPDLNIGLKEGTTLRRGALETVTIQVSSKQSAVSSVTQGFSLDSISLKIGALPESALTGPFTLNPDPVTQGFSLEINKVAATDTNAPSQIAVLTTAVLYPSPGATIKITKTSVANVIASSSALEIYNESLVRGTAAKVRLKLNNIGSALMELLTSENNGQTNQVRINLKDQDGNLLATGFLNQRTGSLIINSGLPSNVSIGGNYATARIEPGNSLLTDPITFTVPESAPYKVYIEADIQNTYY